MQRSITMVRIVYALMSVLLGLGSTCNTVAAADPIKVVVMIQPQRYFVEQIGGNHVDVTVLVPPGADPHTFEPKPQTLVQVSRAHVYIAMGIPEEEAWLPRLKAIRTDIPVVYQDQGIAKMPMETRAEIHGDHPPQPVQAGNDPHLHGNDHGDHRHQVDGLDPHIWLSPKLARLQAATIGRALCTVDSVNCADYQTRLDSFRQRIDDLDQRLTQAFAQLDKHRSFLVVHPSWGYFARDYRLKQIPLEIEGKEPTAADLVKLIQRTAVEGIGVILVEPQFSQRFAYLIAQESGVRMMIADPLALDWESSLWEVGQQLATSLSQHP
jgi:zinc transport system substrate-binding protein